VVGVGGRFLEFYVGGLIELFSAELDVDGTGVVVVACEVLEGYELFGDVGLHLVTVGHM
jgi:hypothetical protein